MIRHKNGGVEEMPHDAVELGIIRKAPMSTAKNPIFFFFFFQKTIQKNSEKDELESKIKNGYEITSHGRERKEPKTWYPERPNRSARKPSY